MDANEEKFEREKTCYEQNFQHFRSLNQIMWQVPMIAITLTGGLWYTVASLKGIESEIKIGLLIFSALANISLTLMIQRVRDVMQAYLDKLKAFYPDGYATAPVDGALFKAKLGDRGVCTMFSITMIMAALCSVVGASMMFYGHWTISCQWG